ncbi:hypothetical protein SEMRO_1984_G309370.1 [Seminavis robusta]|uniref:Uncharacterized protein n=1 Tax=Seminavis robusta TaxID=568900 RepID=A0A9N8HVP8_9STRA|nr:hypothetical protein SEMRO_1984_G309370.1 [Seminavis robusta]|eukprot:Sro1984_g309370.1 n/a (618) ;mRNA; f:12432-14597
MDKGAAKDPQALLRHVTNDSETALAEVGQKPASYYLTSQEELLFCEKADSFFVDNRAQMTNIIARSVGGQKNLDIAVEQAKLHGEEPFFEGGIVTFAADGSIRHEKEVGQSGGSPESEDADEKGDSVEDPKDKDDEDEDEDKDKDPPMEDNDDDNDNDDDRPHPKLLPPGRTCVLFIRWLDAPLPPMSRVFRTRIRVGPDVKLGRAFDMHKEQTFKRFDELNAANTQFTFTRGPQELPMIVDADDTVNGLIGERLFDPPKDKDSEPELTFDVQLARIVHPTGSVRQRAKVFIHCWREDDTEAAPEACQGLYLLGSQELFEGMFDIFFDTTMTKLSLDPSRYHIVYMAGSSQNPTPLARDDTLDSLLQDRVDVQVADGDSEEDERAFHITALLMERTGTGDDSDAQEGQVAATSSGRKQAGQKQKATGGRGGRISAKSGSRSSRTPSRGGRGNRKRAANTPAETRSQQMDNRVREKLDGCEAPLFTAMNMSRPEHLLASYKEPDGSDTESVVNEKKWPKVVPGLFFFTEQKPNANGKGGGEFLKDPAIHFWTGSDQMNDVLSSHLKKRGLKRHYHATYLDFKTAVFGHESIKEAQTNKTRKRTLETKTKKQKNGSDSD